MSQPEIRALTGVRGVAAWWVVLYHIRPALAGSAPAWLLAVLAKGYLAVDLFFVLSGFVMWLTWAPKFAARGANAAPDFLRRRIARIWPLHAAVLAATVAFALVLTATGRPLSAHYRLGELPLHVLLMQNWGFTRDLAWNDPSWSISTELAAYCAFAGLASLLRRGRSLSTLASCLLIVTLVAILDRLFATSGGATLGFDIPGLGLARCLIEFACGALGCMLYLAIAAKGGGRNLAGGLAACVLVLLAGGAAGVRETLAVPLAFAALVPLLAATSASSLNPLSSRVAVTLGEISYSTYLAHFLLWTVFKIAVVRDIGAVPPWQVALYLALTLAASFALHRFVEIPARNALTRNRRGARRLSVA